MSTKYQFIECRENAYLDRGFPLAEKLLQRVPDAEYVSVTFYQGRFHLNYSPKWDYVVLGQGKHWRRITGTPQQAIQIASHCLGGAIQIGLGSYSERFYVVN